MKLFVRATIENDNGDGVAGLYVLPPPSQEGVCELRSGVLHRSKARCDLFENYQVQKLQMTDLLIATEEELRILTKSEREIYDDYRNRGKTREEICKERDITDATFRDHFAQAEKKIRRFRRIQENPQAFMKENTEGESIDILRGGKRYKRKEKPQHPQWDSERVADWSTC